MFPYGAALIPAVKFSWSVGVQLGELLLNRSPSDYERNILLEERCKLPWVFSKASAKPADPKFFLVTLRLVLNMSVVEVFSVTTKQC